MSWPDPRTPSASQATMRSMSARTRPRLVTVPRVVMSLLLALAGGAIYLSTTLVDESPPRLRPTAVKAVSPEPGSNQLHQTEIFAELTTSYRGRLAVNGKPIPDDQLQVIQGLNRISFTPGKGREIEALPAGANCAVVSFDPVPGATGEPGSFRWCFNVH